MFLFSQLLKKFRNFSVLFQKENLAFYSFQVKESKIKRKFLCLKVFYIAFFCFVFTSPFCFVFMFFSFVFFFKCYFSWICFFWPKKLRPSIVAFELGFFFFRIFEWVLYFALRFPLRLLFYGRSRKWYSWCKFGYRSITFRSGRVACQIRRRQEENCVS